MLEFHGVGMEAPGKVPGKIVVTIAIDEHKTFTRHGNDLHMTVEITEKEHAKGFTKFIPHLDGKHKVKLQLKAKDKLASRFFKEVVKGEGMPLRKDPSQFGALVVNVEVKRP